MGFKEQLAKDAASAFVNSKEFGELVTYTPHQDEPRVFAAIVERTRLEPADAGPSGSRFGRMRYEAMIANDAVAGVTEVTVGKDRVEMRLNLQDTEDTTFVVSGIIDQDEGLWHLELTK